MGGKGRKRRKKSTPPLRVTFYLRPLKLRKRKKACKPPLEKRKGKRKKKKKKNPVKKK